MHLADYLFSLGIAPEQDSASGALLQVDDKLEVFLEEPPGEKLIRMLAVVGFWDGEAQTLQTLAVANFEQILTMGSTLGLNPETREIVLTRIERTPGMNAEHFKQALAAVIEAAEFWLEQLALPADPPSGSNPGATIAPKLV